MSEELSVEVGGDRLAASRRGRQPPAFLWAHGLTRSRAAEDDGLAPWTLPDRSRRLFVRYDARGHGRSTGTPDPERYRWSALGRDYLAVADAFGLDRFVAGGASMGCATVLEAALRAPERVERLVLVIPPTAWETRPAQAELYRKGAWLIENHGKDEWVSAVRELPRPEILGRAPEPIFDVGADLLPSVLRGAASSDLPPPERIATLTAPALILAWATDPAHPVSTAERLSGLLRHSRLRVAYDVDELGDWSAEIERFLDE